MIALAIAIIGMGPLAHDPSALRLNTHGKKTHSDSATQDLALAPSEPVSSDGAVGDLAPAVETIAASRKQTEAVIKTAPTRFEGEAPRAVAPPAAISQTAVSSQSASTGTWAVVIGVNDYPGTANDLSSAVNDANDMAQALDMFGVDADHMIVLRDGQVTRNSLLDSVNWLAAHASADSVAGFFYSGHVRKTTTGNEEIVTSDGSSVSDRDLANGLSRVAATRSWVAIAGCYGGGFTEVLRPGRVLTAAADANSLAYENSSIGRSYMVEYMIRQAMIQGRANATVQSAFNYAVSHISAEHPGREPVEIDSGDGALNLRPPGSTNKPSSQPDPGQQPSSPSTTEPPASDRPGKNQHCTGGLFRICTNG